MVAESSPSPSPVADDEVPREEYLPEMNSGFRDASSENMEELAELERISLRKAVVRRQMKVEREDTEGKLLVELLRRYLSK